MEYQVKDVVGYEGLYEVSNTGEVFSLNYNQTGKKEKMKTRPDKGGYLYLNLYKHGKAKSCKVHRLVAQAFLPNPNNLPQVNHKDENKQNNNVENLEFCDNRYNILYSGNHLKGTKAAAKVNSKPIVQYTLDGEFVAEYPSTMEAERQTGFSHQSIGKCCNGRYGFKTCGGYKWKYKIIN